MTQIQPTIRTMTFDEADQAGLFNRSLVLEYKNMSYKLNSGTGDKIHVFLRSIYLFVLTINRPLGYT
jgi:hypothetical protein